jgi:hypothetical protein
MRLSFIGSAMIVLALLGLEIDTAAARHASRISYYRYANCSCRFGRPGYVNYSDRDCTPQVSCLAEGGRCSGSCASQPQSE